MKNTFVVSAITENHFFTTFKKANEDFQLGVETYETLKINGEICIYEVPENLDENITENEHFTNCLINGTAKEIEKKTI